jgi:hypothetical protein
VNRSKVVRSEGCALMFWGADGERGVGAALVWSGPVRSNDSSHNEWHR